MRTPRLLIAASLLLCTGCFQGQRVITVNADGSGTIADTLTVGEQLKAMMAAAADKNKGPEKEKQHQAAAAAMGPGVTFVSDEMKDGVSKTAYAFKDISKIKVEISPGPDSGEKKEEGKDKSEPLTFRFVRQGGKSVLTVVQPLPKKAEGQAKAPEGMQDMAMSMWTMMKGMMKGLKLKTVLEVNGKIAKATSPYVQGSTVTLLEMDFDQITADDANFKKFTKAGEDPSTMDIKALQGVKGMKINPDQEVVVEFTGK
jgi:hypothetical protein